MIRHLAGADLPPLGFPILGRPDAAARTLRACWHLLTVFGWTLALLVHRVDDRFTIRAIAVALAVSALVMIVFTRGKHAGGPGFAVAAALCWLGAP